MSGFSLKNYPTDSTYLVKKKEADYVFTVKDNQPSLKQDIATLGLDAFPPSAHDRR